jgi:antitoxin (DNA-binding transcriptional repressor) of toxin-antitoxin stability system
LRRRGRRTAACSLTVSSLASEPQDGRQHASTPSTATWGILVRNESEGAVIEVSLQEAEEQLEKLLEDAAAGEDVIITSKTGAAVRLVALPKDESNERVVAGEVVGHKLDRFIGTWSAEQAAELLQATEVFEQVDESFWT